MKKIATWAMVTAFIAFVIDWGVVGLKLLNGDYDITAGVYIAGACFVIMIVCIVYYKAFSSRCNHCEKMLQSNGKYCPYCGKEI